MQGAYVTDRKLYRSRHACVGGVCAGIAEYLDFDAIVVRILAVLLAAITFGLAIIGYCILWRKLPLESEGPVMYDVLPEKAESTSFGDIDCQKGFARRKPFNEYRNSYDGNLSMVARLAIAASLMMLFLAVSINVSPMVSGSQWWQFWPMGVIIIGLCLIIIPVRSRFEAAWHALGIAITSGAAMMLPMSLGVLSWFTIPYVFQHLWFLLVIAITLWVIGLRRGIDAFVLIAGFLVAAYCLYGLYSFPVAGEFESLMLVMPDGRSFLIGMG